MNDINQDITRMIVEMRELGKLPAPCKGGSHNNLLRYNKLRDRILDKLLSAFDEGYRLKNSNRPPEEIDRILDAYGRGMTLRTETAQRLEIVKDIKTTRLCELAQADKEGRCVVMPCQPGDKVSYKSSTGFWCNAVIKDYTPENIFITAETEIPNAEPLSHTFSILEIEAALRREKE